MKETELLSIERLSLKSWMLLIPEAKSFAPPTMFVSFVYSINY